VATPATDGRGCHATARAMLPACECCCQGVARVARGTNPSGSPNNHKHRQLNWGLHAATPAAGQAGPTYNSFMYTARPDLPSLLHALVQPCCSFLNGKSLAGSIPSDPGLWAGLTGLTNLDLANNQLSGSVPAAIKSAPLLTNV
jgi:hypothetical protein